MSGSERPSQQYQRLLDYLHSDIEDLPLDAEPVAIDRGAVLAAARKRAGRIRFLRARAEMEAARTRSSQTKLSDQVIRKAREILDQIVQGDAGSLKKFSLAFRSGKALPDDEVLSILSEFQALGHDLDAIAQRLRD
ncbi:hypothetical protein [Luteimonas sp. YGD11-2]|uniref:hypothetical protein n=1 Tax=Luteimonas sp. YGD11-2 TaxID=2508168 RepID=UPI00100A4B83|nr:hypothetical protein [Luteimonas sp. YGD11-2]